MICKIRGYIASKKSELYSDCADDYALNIDHHKFAISDGVSKSFFPKVWSEILVRKYVGKKDWVEDNFIDECQKDWQSKIDHIVSRPETRWFTKSQYNRNEPALATFVGLQFIESQQKWIAQALGDSFLFFIPENSNKIETKLSSKTEPIKFDNFPDYLSSIGSSHKGEKKLIKAGKIQAGTFYLMTDALAEWFLLNTEEAKQKLDNIQNQQQFLVTIENERNAKKLNDDDSAVLIIELTNDGKKEFSYSESEITLLSECIKTELEETEESKKIQPLPQHSLIDSTEENEKNIAPSEHLELKVHGPSEQPKASKEPEADSLQDHQGHGSLVADGDIKEDLEIDGSPAADGSLSELDQELGASQPSTPHRSVINSIFDKF